MIAFTIFDIWLSYSLLKLEDRVHSINDIMHMVYNTFVYSDFYPLGRLSVLPLVPEPMTSVSKNRIFNCHTS